MAPRQELKVKVLNKEGIVFEGDCQALLVPTVKEIVAILPQHTPLIALLSAGKVTLVTSEGKKDIASLNHGIIYVGHNEASVLVNA